VRMDGDAIGEARIGLVNMGNTPLRASATERALVGVDHPGGIADAADLAAEGTNPPSDLNGDADYRRHLVKVLTRRAVQAATEG
jgi:carbon-monoxide dehydrogenase medium subunit